MNYCKEIIRRVKRIIFRLSREGSIRKRKYQDIAEKAGDQIRLNLGCGSRRLDDYINIDIVPSEATDLIMDIADIDCIPPNTIEEVRMDAVFEHLHRFQQENVLKAIHRILKNNGKLVINWLPDFDVIIRAYLTNEKGIRGDVFDIYNVYRYTHGEPDQTNCVYQIHKDIYTKSTMTDMLLKSGFKIESLKNVTYPGEHLPLNINLIALKM